MDYAPAPNPLPMMNVLWKARQMCATAQSSEAV